MKYLRYQECLRKKTSQTFTTELIFKSKIQLLEGIRKIS